MLFYRRGEITDEQERNALNVREAGDEYQKGLALAALSVILILCSVVLLITYAIYQRMGDYKTARSVRTIGKCAVCGLGSHPHLQIATFVD